MEKFHIYFLVENKYIVVWLSVSFKKIIFVRGTKLGESYLAIVVFRNGTQEASVA